jgi:uncharacterized protein
MIEMFVAAISQDAQTHTPIVILHDATKRRALPIWIGLSEAKAILLALDSRKLERPMTHDLLLNTIAALDYKVEKVEINELSKSTYYATIVLKLVTGAGKGKIELLKNIDSRPSDAIALALRAKAPIFVSAQVVAEGTHPIDLEKDEAEAKAFKSFLDGVTASDFLRHKGSQPD